VEEQTEHRTNVPTRLRFVLGSAGVDVAVPADVPLADLLPAVLTQCGPEWREPGAEHEGWVVQLLGGPPLDDDRTLRELNLVDGQTLYLRPRADQVAPADYDDLVDGVAEQVRDAPDAWTTSRTRWMLLAGAGLTLLTGLGAAPVFSPILSAVIACCLLFGAGILARSTGRVVVATILAGVAAGHAGVAGWLAASALDPSSTSATHFACATAAVVMALVAGVVAVADAALLFTSALTCAVLLLLPAVLASVSSVDVAGAAAIGLVFTLVTVLFVPGLAFRLGGLTLPMLPTDADELRQDIDPVPHEVVVRRGAAVFGYLKALHIGIGLAQVELCHVLVGNGDGWALTLTAVFAVLLWLRSRHLGGTVQRWSLIGPAGFAIAITVLRLAAGADPLVRVLGFGIPLLAAGIGLIVLSAVLPGRRLRPYWGRAADIFELLTAIAVLPVLLAVLRVYALIRGASG
jgi:type VII secretion integral membrane protein EccD